MFPAAAILPFNSFPIFAPVLIIEGVKNWWIKLLMEQNSFEHESQFEYNMLRCKILEPKSCENILSIWGFCHIS